MYVIFHMKHLSELLKNIQNISALFTVNYPSGRIILAIVLPKQFVHKLYHCFLRSPYYLMKFIFQKLLSQPITSIFELCNRKY